MNHVVVFVTEKETIQVSLQQDVNIYSIYNNLFLFLLKLSTEVQYTETFVSM